MMSTPVVPLFPVPVVNGEPLTPVKVTVVRDAHGVYRNGAWRCSACRASQRHEDVRARWVDGNLACAGRRGDGCSSRKRWRRWVEGKRRDSVCLRVCDQHEAVGGINYNSGRLNRPGDAGTRADFRQRAIETETTSHRNDGIVMELQPRSINGEQVLARAINCPHGPVPSGRLRCSGGRGTDRTQ